jgi:MFS family permease
VGRLSESLAALSEPEFRKLFLGQAVSVVGMMFTVVALPFAVLEIGGSASDIGIVEAANLVPLIVFLLVGGVWADRLPRQKVMLAADFLRTTLQMTAAALLVIGAAEVWHLALLQVGMGACEAFFRPAYTGLVPEVVSSPRLQPANALQGLVASGATTVGAATAGLLVAALGAGWAIGIDGVSYLVSAWFLWRLRPREFRGRATAGLEPGGEGATEPGQAAVVRSSFLGDLAAGWREFVGHTWLWVMVAGASAFLFAIEGPVTVLGPIVSRESYDGPRTWGFAAAAMGLGSVVGGLLSLWWRPRRPMLVLAGGMGFAAVPVALLAARMPVWSIFLAMVALGVEWGLYDVFWVTCMQNEVAPELISRVSSYDYLGSLAFFPAGLALAGPLAEAFGVSSVLWGSAAVAVVVSLFQLSWRDVRAEHALRGPTAAEARESVERSAM